MSDDIEKEIFDNEVIAPEPISVDIDDFVSTSVDNTNVDDTQVSIAEVKKTLEANSHVTCEPKYAAIKPAVVPGGGGDSIDIDFLSLPNENTKELDSLEKISNKEVTSQVRTKEGIFWVQDMSRSSEFYNVEQRFDASVNRENSEWKQFLEYETKRVRGGENKLGENTPVMAGNQAVKAIRSALNLSNSITKPLWNSGIWVHIEAPSDLSLLNLDRTISHYLEDLGYKTLGLVYSNEMVYINNLVVELALDHITHSSLADHSVENLRKVISVHDIGLLASYLGLLSYPNGYKTRRPCVNSPTSCTHVFEGLLDLRNIWYVDNSRLTLEEKRFVIDSVAKRKVEEVLDYQSAINAKTNKNVFNINNRIRVVLQTPQHEGYAEHGSEWVTDIATMIDGSTIKSTTSAKARAEAIATFANASRARNYSHYVKEVIINNDEAEDSVIVDKAAIKDILTEFSSVILREATEELPEQTAADLLIEKVGEYIDDATIVVIALPKFACPVCNAVQSDGYDLHPHLITIDPVRLFFTLVARKHAKVS